MALRGASGREVRERSAPRERPRHQGIRRHCISLWMHDLQGLSPLSPGTLIFKQQRHYVIGLIHLVSAVFKQTIEAKVPENQGKRPCE